MLAHAPCCQESGSTVGVHGTLALGATSRCLFTIDITKVIYAGLPVDISVFQSLRKVHSEMIKLQPFTPFSKSMAQDFDLCHLFCNRSHFQTHLRHLPQQYSRLTRVSRTGGEKTIEIQSFRNTFLGDTCAIYFDLHGFPQKKYWIDGASSNLWAILLTCVFVRVVYGKKQYEM